MDLSYNLVASKCASQLAAYQQCVLQNQHSDWASICKPQSNALTICADESIPHLAQMKSTCSPLIQSYTSCLSSASNQGLSDEKTEEMCREGLRGLWECCERVVGGAAGGEGK